MLATILRFAATVAAIPLCARFMDGVHLIDFHNAILVGVILAVLYTLLRELTNSRLDKREIAAEKLLPQPPELKSHRKERRRNTWNKWKNKLKLKKK